MAIANKKWNKTMFEKTKLTKVNECENNHDLIIAITTRSDVKRKESIKKLIESHLELQETIRHKESETEISKIKLVTSYMTSNEEIEKSKIIYVIYGQRDIT